MPARSATRFVGDSCHHRVVWEPPPGVRCSDSELWAATRLEDLLGRVVLADVPGGPEGSHDFDVEVGGDVWAVEVTSTTNPSRRRVSAGIRDRGMTSLSIDGRTTWLVGLQDDAEVKVVAAQLPEIIGQLAARGQMRVDLHDDFADPLVRSLDAIRVQSVYGIEGSRGRILLQPAAFGGWGWQGPDVDAWLSNWLQGDQAVNKLGKLARSSSHRMLVVVLDSFSQPGLGIPLGLSSRLERDAAYVLPTVDPSPNLSALWLLPDTLSGEGLQWHARSGWSVLPPHQDRPPWIDTIDS